MKRFRRLICFILVLAILVGVTALSINFYVIADSKSKIITIDEAKELADVDYILVLGCGVKSDGTPSHMLRERLKTGAEVLNVVEGAKLLLSGDNSGDHYNEPKVMKKVSLENGVPEDKIIIDDFGFSTSESLVNTSSLGCKKLIIITQPYHMYRALYIAKSLGMEAYGVTAWLPFYPKQIIWSLREVIARNKDFFLCQFKLKGTQIQS